MATATDRFENAVDQRIEFNARFGDGESLSPEEARSKATREVVKENPALHQAWLSEYNAARKNNRFRS
jgi:hypothetical protein